MIRVDRDRKVRSSIKSVVRIYRWQRVRCFGIGMVGSTAFLYSVGVSKYNCKVTHVRYKCENAGVDQPIPVALESGSRGCNR